jgi:hypothetical protein
LSLTEPISNYSDILFFLIIIDVILTLSVGIYYLYRYKKHPVTITLLWSLAFLSSGIGNSLHLVIEYGFPSFFGMLGWDYYHLFQKGSVLFFTVFLGFSIFYVKLINEKGCKIGKIIIISLTILATISLIIEFCFLIPIFSFSSWITRIMAFWVIFFFAYFSISSKNYRILAITIGFLIATITGIIMATFKGTSLDIIAHMIHFAFYFFIAYGLFFTRPKKE